MVAIAEHAAQQLYARAGIATNAICGAVRLAIALFGPDCVRYAPRGALPSDASTSWFAEHPVIHLREDLDHRKTNHSVATAISEWHLRTSHHSRLRSPELVGRIKAALCVPRPAFMSAWRDLGEDISALSHAFAVSESLMALRIAECLGHPTALVTARRVRTRGRKRDWPASPEGWSELLTKADRSGLVVHRLRDARERLVLVAR